MAALNHPANIQFHSAANPACGRGEKARPALAAFVSPAFFSEKAQRNNPYLGKKVAHYGWTFITEDFYPGHKCHSA